MSFFRQEDLDSLRATLASIEERADALTTAFVMQSFRSNEARQYAQHGVARRVATVARCIQRVFEMIPPETENVPAEQDRQDTVIYIQAAVFNTYGLIDNLALNWVHETGLRKQNGTEIPKGMIGLTSKSEDVRNSLPEWMQDYLLTMDAWFKYLIDYRHALSHRIPLYVPPYSIDPDDIDAYNQLERSKQTAVLLEDTDRYGALMAKQTALGFFVPTSHIP